MGRFHDKVVIVTGASSVIEVGRIVGMAYKRHDETLVPRAVRPLHPEFWRRVWTLRSWCELRSRVRVFRIDRIERLEMTDRTFREDRGTSYKDYLFRLDAVEARS